MGNTARYKIFLGGVILYLSILFGFLLLLFLGHGKISMEDVIYFLLPYAVLGILLLLVVRFSGVLEKKYLVKIEENLLAGGIFKFERGF